MTFHLKTALSKVSFEILVPIVKKAKEDISFFGGRYISVEGYQGSIDIDGLAARAMELANEKSEFSLEERQAGREIVPLIDKLYENNYARVNKHLITRIFCVFRDFLRGVAIVLGGIFGNGGKGAHFTWLHGRERKFFNYYTFSQYETFFGEAPTARSSYSNPAKVWYRKD